MAGLQRSAVSFRRQGSSGLVWDDRFISEELNKAGGHRDENEQPPGQSSEQEKSAGEIREVSNNNNNTAGNALRPINTVERSRSNGGGRGYRTGKVSPAVEPPSPKLSACGFCGAFGKTGEKDRRSRQQGKHRSR